MRRDDGRYDWDVPLGRRWIVLLLTAWTLPVVLPVFGEMAWVWPWSVWSESSPVEILMGLIPVGLGIIAWIVLGLPRRRLRGGLLLLACAASMLLPYGQIFRGIGGNSTAWDVFLRIGWQALAVTLGLAAVVAGNRQQKQSLGSGPAPWIAGLGGLAILAVFFVPITPADLGGRGGRGLMAVRVFFEAEAWEKIWPLLVWLIGLVVLAAMGALSPLSARIGDPLQAFVERTISRLARLLPWTLPLVIVGMYVGFGAPGLGYFLLFFAKILLHGYAVVVLMTIGLARLLDGADPQVVYLQEAETESSAGEGEPAASPA